jgi:lipopolysaccharide/colanic/teichoic acid biosynthesis glycosyltransferase
MGRPQSIILSETATTATTRRDLRSVKRGADVVVSVVLLLVAVPAFAIAALMVRLTSHGPVLHREPSIGRRGTTVELLSFRTRVDGAGTEAHARVRAVVGATDAYTPVGRFLSRLRLERLPRLVNILRGDTSLF